MGIGYMKAGITYLIIILNMYGCIPSTPLNTRSGTEKSTINPIPSPDDNYNESGNDLFWYSSGQQIDGNITINSDTETVIYLRGDDVHSFLENYFYTDSTNQTIQQYCLVFDFSSGTTGAKEQFRSRVFPISINNFSTGSTERIFRIDLPSKTDNQNVCGGEITSVGTCKPSATHSTFRKKSDCENASGTWETGQCVITSITDQPTCGGFGFSWDSKCYTPSYTEQLDCQNYAKTLSTQTAAWQETNHSITSSESAFIPSNVCSGCNGILNLENLSLYKSSSNLGITNSTMITSDLLNLKQVSMRIDVKNQSQNPVGQCDDVTCSAGGLDCCQDGQCVNDMAIKSSVNTTSSEYIQAMQDVASNPSSYINWPNIFHSCSNSPIPQPTPTATVDPIEEAQKEFEQKKMDYSCIVGSKQTTPDYSSCCLEGSSNCSSSTYACLWGAKQATPDYSSCCIGSNCGQSYYSDVQNVMSDPSSRFSDVQTDIWARCGCAATSATPAPYDDQTLCAGIELQSILETDNITIKDITCKYPDPIVEPTPFSNTSVSVNNRSVPHRFFSSTTGSSIDDITQYSSQSITPEGTPFYYLDDSGKTEPDNGQFNMNSVLGQMSVELTQALPANQLDIEYDQVYIISVTNGYYTPCTLCSKDGWFINYTSHPTTTEGFGLEATGYTTSRFGGFTNSTNGNYEDTIFGRACWIPPTMIPFSHYQNSNLNTQRQNRLQTQATFFVNGYQRDWFGFNKGAVIGSFDGVTWFAIGGGRRIKSTSTKLFLAINAPFGDLADPGGQNINVVVDLGNDQTAADYDYDPSIALNDPNQNRGASCRKWHQCESDSDCVTQLGWEYTCSDVTRLKTRWPIFDIDANELGNSQLSSASFTGLNQVLYNFAASQNNKRCVYRGDGAICKAKYSSTMTYTQDQKLFTCAPNFYCATLGSGEFNSEVAREPELNDNFTIGQEANYLGRPLNYIYGFASLSSSVQSNIKYNASLFSTDTSDFGLCRPGKYLGSGTNLTQHQNKDSSYRTDYISQIGSCNSSATGDSRVWSCPIFDSAGDIITSYSDYTIHNQQNMCGGETTNSSGVSPFIDIEADPISGLSFLDQPSIAKDACLRRAGSVCQTDLDCGPNRLHASKADGYSLSYFGNTDAEQQFWKEELVCRQDELEPLATLAESTAYYAFDVTKNRCCREINKDFTMVTTGNETIIPDLGANNTNLETDKFPKDNPKADGRYSRYQVVAPIGTPAATGTPYYEVPEVITDTTPKPYQWRTISDTGSKNCCGNTWIRKFKDKSHDWSTGRDFNFNYSNFSCLNYSNDLIFTDDVSIFNLNPLNFARDKNKICAYPTAYGCIQNEFEGPTNYEIKSPEKISNPYAILRTGPASGNGSLPELSEDVWYEPIPYTNPVSMTNTDVTQEENFFAHNSYTGVSFYLPTYIHATSNNDISNFSSVPIAGPEEVRIYYYDSGGNACSQASVAVPNVACTISNNPQTDLNAHEWCLTNDPISDLTIFHAKADSSAGCGTNPWSYARIFVGFIKPQTTMAVHSIDPTLTLGNALDPGNTLYYLSKLGRLELIGIPQIFYEPLYCNSNMDRLIPDLYKNMSTRNDFDNNSFSFSDTISGASTPASIYNSNATSSDDTNPNEKIVFQDKLNLDEIFDKDNDSKIFSANNFTCCKKLNSEVDSDSECCSNYTILDTQSGNKTCKLPPKTNLHVYLNRFVSNEGIDESLDTPLKDSDFIPLTGEPKFDNSVNDKIFNLGLQFCSSKKVIAGGSAFGYYKGQGDPQTNNTYYNYSSKPDDGFRLSIVDSLNDTEIGAKLASSPEKSAREYEKGFRWNHHYYCDVEGE